MFGGQPVAGHIRREILQGDGPQWIGPCEREKRVEDPRLVVRDQCVEIRDLTRNYGYQNIFKVSLAVTATFPGTDEVFERTLEKMGVFAEDLDESRRLLMEAFKETGLPYLLKQGFANRMDMVNKAKPPRPTGYGGYR